MATQASWDDPGTDPGPGNRKAVPNEIISSSMMNWILHTIANVDLPDLDYRLGNAETELQNARGTAASLDARLDAFLNEDGSPRKSQLEQGGAHELVGIVLQGTDTSKPAAGVAGRFWLSTDTKALYYDNGTSWVLIGKLAGLDLSNHGARHKAGGADAILPDTIANVLTDHTKSVHDALGIDAATLNGESAADIAWKKIAEINVTAGVAQVTFTNLNINAHRTYRLVYTILNEAGNNVSYKCCLNNDLTNTSYYAQRFRGSGTSATIIRDNAPSFIENVANGRAVVGEALIYLDAAHFPRVINIFSENGDGNISSGIYSIGMPVIQDNITQIDILASLANGIGSGSRLTLYGRLG